MLMLFFMISQIVEESSACEYSTLFRTCLIISTFGPRVFPQPRYYNLVRTKTFVIGDYADLSKTLIHHIAPSPGHL